MVTKIGLDLGYANITVSDCLAEIFREPSVALMHKSPGAEQRILYAGEDAISADARGELSDCVLVRPFKNGLLYDTQVTKEVIRHIFRALGNYDKLRCVIGVPADITQKEEKELFAMLTDAGVDVAASVSRPIAALIGAGYSPSMSVISVNIGALSTEVAIIHKGKIIHQSRTEVGGEDFDKAVKQHILDQGDVNLSLSVARSIKEKLGAVWKGRPNDTIEIEGTLSLTGGKLKMRVSTEDIVGVFEEPLRKILTAISAAVRSIPSDMVKDIFVNGIVLTGGGAQLFGMDVLISKVLGISVTRPQSPMDSVSKGLARINVFIPPKAKILGKNITHDVAKYYEASKTKRGGKNEEQ